MTATHHGEAVGVMKVSAARQQRDGLLAGIDQVVVFLALCRGRAHAEYAVLALQHDFAVGGEIVGNGRRHSDAEIDVGAVVNVLSDALCKFLLGSGFVRSHLVSFAAVCLAPFFRCGAMLTFRGLRVLCAAPKGRGVPSGAANESAGGG